MALGAGEDRMESEGAGIHWRFDEELLLTLPIPALLRTDDLTLLALMTVMPDSPLGQLDSTDSSSADRLPEEIRELTEQVRPSLESHVDLVLELTAKLWPGELSDRKGVLTSSKTLPSMRALVPLPTSKA